jgi:steroid 5-alpha reductase family enzyme
MMSLVLFLTVGLVLTMIAAWQFQKSVGNAGWVDVFWTAGIGVFGTAVSLAPLGGSASPTSRQWLVAGLVAIWALRLGLHLGLRVAHSAEDVRYANFRKEWGAAFQRRMFWFLQIQAFAAIFLTLSILLAAHNPAPGLGGGGLLGAFVLAVAVVGEGVADYQLRRFKLQTNHKGRVCDVGLWRWSRHPNYFFEWIVWIAYPLIGIDFSGGYAWGWFALSAPAIMYWLLVHVSGIPPLEKQMLRSRGDAYRAYMSRTSAFFPLPPRISTAMAAR